MMICDNNNDNDDDENDDDENDDNDAWLLSLSKDDSWQYFCRDL